MEPVYLEFLNSFTACEVPLTLAFCCLLDFSIRCAQIRVAHVHSEEANS